MPLALFAATSGLGSHKVALAMVGIVALTTLASARAHAQPGGAPIQVTVHGLHSDKGKVACSLFTSADGFPSDVAKAKQRHFAPIVKGRAVCEFAAIAKGTYAVSVMHDEDEDGKLKKNFVGMPKEGVGSSRDARPRFMGPPRFEDAAFVHGDQPSALTVNIRYL